jgi:hypothetical protein
MNAAAKSDVVELVRQLSISGSQRTGSSVFDVFISSHTRARAISLLGFELNTIWRRASMGLI